MSDTDIYKNREPMPYSPVKTKRSHRRRRSTPQRAFDDHTRKRRSRNSGLRRVLHLYRKEGTEKVVWLTMLVVVVVLLASIAVWQFVIREHQIKAAEETAPPVQAQSSANDTEPSVAE